MKKLVIYYSHTGSSELVAKTLEEKGYEIRRVEEKKKLPKSFFWSMMVGGFRAGTAQKGKLVDYNPDVSKYDEIVIATPIWNGLPTPVLNSIIDKTDFSDKKLCFVFSAGGGEAPKTVKKIHKIFPDANIIVLKDPKKYPNELEKIKDL